MKGNSNHRFSSLQVPSALHKLGSRRAVTAVGLQTHELSFGGEIRYGFAAPFILPHAPWDLRPTGKDCGGLTEGPCKSWFPRGRTALLPPECRVEDAVALFSLKNVHTSLGRKEKKKVYSR